MRILAVTPYYEPEGGGLERYAHEILQRLAARGHEVQVLTFTKTGLPDGHRDGVDVRRETPWMRLGNSPISLSFHRRVREGIRAFRPDVVVAHTPVPFPAEIAAMAARREGIPFVATYHAGRLRGSSFILDMVASLDRATLERRMLATSQRLIAVGPFVRDHALVRERSRVTIVPPGVDTTRFRPAQGPAGRGILFVGPLANSYRWKGLDTLWQAFQAIRRESPDVGLTLVGDGDRADEFRRHAETLGGPLRLAGRVTPEGLVAEYQRAGVAVLPSRTDAESFGMVLAEANACGRPVVASRIGGIPDFVRHGENGLLAKPGHADDLAAQIQTVLRDPEMGREMGERGRARVERHHRWDDLALATERVLDEAAHRRPLGRRVPFSSGFPSLEVRAA